MSERIINILAKDDELSKKILLELEEKLDARGFLTTRDFSNEAELSIVIGGDGSFLRSVHENDFPEVPFVGFNTGHLGFFQELSIDDVDKFVESYIAGEFKQESLHLIETSVHYEGGESKLYSVNEMVVKANKSKAVELDVFINSDYLERFFGDGLIVSTPAGSTAYNYSVRGSVVHPKLECIQMTPLAPINSKAFRSLQNSIIVPPNFIIRFEPKKRYEGEIILLNDGEERIFKNVTSVEINLSYKKIYRIVFSKNIYWNNLKDKFL